MDELKKRSGYIRESIQGVAVLGILYYIVFSDYIRVPVEIYGPLPGNVFASSPAFLFWMLLIYFIEGAKAADFGREKDDSPVRRALGYYITYWKVCLPLVLIGALFFTVEKASPLYCYMFTNLGFLNVSRAIVGLTNNIHEGTWLVSSIAICAFCGSMYFRIREKKGGGLALLALAAGIVAHCGLYLVIMPFMYHKAVFPVAAVTGSAAYALGLLLFERPAVAECRPVRALEDLSGKRAFARWTAPLRYIGSRWLAFWLVQFYVTIYYYNIASSVRLSLGNTILAYLAFLVLTAATVYVIEAGWRWLEEAVKKNPWTVPAILLTLAIPFLLRWVLELSMDSYAQFAHVAKLQWPFYALVNVLGIFCLMMFFRALTGHWLPAGLIVILLMTLLGIANHFTMKYHGALLTVEDISNVKTAAGVVGSYDLSVDDIVGKILLVAAAALACCLGAFIMTRRPKLETTRRQRWLRRVGWLLAAVFGMTVAYFAAEPLVARQDNIWSWGSLYAQIGYFSGTVESTLANLAFSVYKPEGYSVERIQELKAQAEAQPVEAVAAAGDQDYPDIVMILNETYYDLEKYVDTNADFDYMANYNALDNAVKGYAEVPLTGGGTNGTEYEMLTANSMSLINAYAPFNRLNFNHTVSLPSYLKQLGYASLAAHPHESQNYHRGASWAQMGIDQAYFIRDFTDKEFYASRTIDNKITDTCALKNLIRFMEGLPEDQPRFAFLVTMQNHGGWTANAPEENLVHTAVPGASEGVTRKIDEFLSCIAVSDQMIAYMREYYTQLYEETGRRVIVCMVGDHSPSFIPQLESLCKWQDAAVAARMGKVTPYFIWANYPLDLEGMDLEGTEDMDLCCFMPTLLKVAGIPLSYYYQYICDMNRDVPAYTNVDTPEEESGRIAFYDRESRLHYLDEDSPVARTVRDYFYMEYNLTGSDMESALFLPPGAQAGEDRGD